LRIKMKVLVSHDVDHVGFYEHVCDGIAVKFFCRSFFELVTARISFGTLWQRIWRSYKNSWNNINSICDFDSKNGIPSTFFVGVANGLGMSYALDDAVRIIEVIQKLGFEVGVHGIAFDDPLLIQKEHDNFSIASGMSDFGVRLHYLRLSSKTKTLLKRAGYLYDATEIGPTGPLIQEGLVELPVTIMDGRLIERRPFGIQVSDFQTLMNRTKRAIESAEDSGVNYISILFHDRYFSAEFPFWKRWYTETVSLLKSEGHEFVSHRDTARSIMGQKKIIYEHTLS